MLLSPKPYILLLLFPLLAACVSIDSKAEYAADASQINQVQMSCGSLPAANEIATDSRGLDPENIAFLNWNIYKENGDNWQQDLSSLAASHDVMTIQEAYLDDELSALLQAHDFNWVMNTAFYLNGSAAGVLNAASIDAVSSCGFKTMEPLIRIPKSTLVSYYNIQGSEQRLLVANIHGINFTFGTEDYRQQLDSLYESIKHHVGPMIVAGDFNTWSDARMAEVGKLVELLSLSSLEYTVNNKTHVFGNAIDHVFFRQLEPVSNHVWLVTSSDHNPISVNFRYNGSLI